MLDGLLSSIGSLASSGISSAMNLKMAREQMAFQERMSNTAHAREVKDLRNAGLNPILSATGGGGASSPPGAMGQFSLSTGTPSADVTNAKEQSSTSEARREQTSRENSIANATEGKLKADTLLSLESAKTQKTQQFLNTTNATVNSLDARFKQLGVKALDNTISSAKNMNIPSFSFGKYFGVRNRSS